MFTLVFVLLWLFTAHGWLSQTSQSVDAEQHLRQARALFDQRRFAEAAAAARLAREANQSLVAAWKLSGLALQLSQQLPQAEQEFTAALQRFPSDADLWFYLSRAQYLQGSLKPAEQSARRALELKSDHPDAHAQLGMICDALQDYDAALKHFQRAIELNHRQKRSQTLPLVYAGQLLSKLGRFAEALEYLSQAVNINPHSSEIHRARGRALEKLGRAAEAEKEYQQAVALD